MVDYTITSARSARKELEALVKEPRPSGCRKLQGEKNLWRICIGDYRVIYAAHDDEHLVDIIAVRHRSKAYD